MRTRAGGDSAFKTSPVLSVVPNVRSVIAWLLVAPGAVWATVRTAGWELGFPWVTLLALTPYALPMAVGFGALAAALRRAGPVVVAAITVLVLAASLAPRALGGAEQSTGTPLRIMTVNMFEGRVRPAALIDLVRRRRIDVLSLQELTPEAARALDRAGLRRLLPHAILRPHEGSTGLGIFARKRMRELPARTFSSLAAETKPASAPPVELFAVHARAPVTDADTERWREDLRALPSASLGGPVRVLVGDFNATLDHRQLRDLVDRGYRDAAAVVGTGLHPTWRGSRLPWLTLDHVLVSRRVAVQALTVHRLPETDHRAVVAVVTLPPA